ncbi:MAG: hypothetical protein KBA06_04190, partial [Saprospiraceae bacterium]|nr:hypothetical protein [Saprospiraceae bacterium]
MIKLKFQTYLKLTLYIFFLFIGINRINATHIVGGELTYKCLGNNQFEITLLVYRDCINGDVYFDNPASIGIFNSNNQLVDSLSMPFRSVDDTLNIFNPCLVSQPNVCVHRTVYRDTIDLPFLTGGYTLAYQRCCRNETLNNIVLPLETGATYTTIITEDALLNCNSQATFLSWPPIYICANTPFTYNHSAIDSDGDSLSYKLCVPYSGATKAFPHPLIPSNPPYDTVIWNGIYSLNNLLGGVPLTIDEHTGIMTAIPNIIGQFVVGVCVDEYRDGVLIGQTRRDFQYNVRECIPTTALFDAPQAQCDNYTVTFDNQSLNSNNFLWNFNDPGNPDFTSTLENPSYTFSDTGRYQVMLIVQPGEICEDTITKSIYIQDNSIVGDFDYQINSCQTLISVQMTSTLSDTISGLNTWNWTVSNETGTLFTSNDPTPTFNFNQSDTLQITLHTYSANGCERTLTKTVPIYLINDTLLSDSIDICNGQSAALNPINNDQLIYSWSPASGLNNALNPNPIASPATSTLYTVTISDPSNRCSLTRSIYVAVHPFGIQIPDVIQNCQPSLQISSGPGDINNVYTWSTDPNFTNVIGNQNTVVVNPVGNLNYYYIRVVDNFGCSVIDSVRVEGNPINVELPNNFQAACSTDEIDLNIVNQIPSEQLTYAWTPTELFVAGTENTASPVLNSNIIGYHQVYVNVSNNSGCNIIDTSNVLILNNPVMDFEVGSIGCNGVTVNFNNLSVNAGLYQWTFFDTENNVLGTSNSINPSFTFPNLGEYHVMLTIGANVVCNDTIVKTITLSDPLNLASIGYEIVGCNNGVSIQFTNNSNTLTPIVYNVWSFGNGQLSFLANPLITFNQSGNFEVTLAIGTQAGCFDTTSVIIPINMINFNPEPVYYCDASPTVVLNSNGNGALNYNWSPSNAVDNPTSPNPTANSALSTIFTVTITDPATSCNIIDTVSLVSLNNIDLDFTPIQSCNSYVVSFLNQSNNALSYHWNFGDPSTTFDVSNSSNPIYIYPSTGVYNIELSLGFDTVCVQPVIKTVNTTDPLIADFSYESTNCLAVATIDFHNESIGGSTDNNYLWYFNNGTTSTLENPTVNTTQTPFVATLLVTNPSNGCNDVITKEFHIQTISVNIPDSLTICDHTPVNLNQGGNLAYQYHWSPATGLNNPNIANPLANPLTTTTYFVTVTNASLFDTCVIVKQVKVIVPPVDLNLSVTNDTIICQG